MGARQISDMGCTPVLADQSPPESAAKPKPTASFPHPPNLTGTRIADAIRANRFP